jgi:hypothetical protein
MIRQLDGMPSNVLGFEASGKVRTEDYTAVLVPALEAAKATGDKLRIVFAFTGEFDGLEPGAVWQDLKAGIKDWNAWERVALVTDNRWMRDGVSMFAWAMPGEVKAFEAGERDAAVAWAAGTA